MYQAELIRILQQFNELLLCELSIWTRGNHVSGLLIILILLDNGLPVLIDHETWVHLCMLLLFILLLLLDLLLVQEELLLLFLSQLFQELLLLSGLETLKHLQELDILLLLLLLCIHGRAGLLDARVDDILRLALFLLRRHLVDDLLLSALRLGLLLGQERCLLILVFNGLLLGGMMCSTLQSWEEVIEEDTLARLSLSSLALRGLLITTFLRVLGRLAAPTASADRRHVLRVDLGTGTR